MEREDKVLLIGLVDYVGWFFQYSVSISQYVLSLLKFHRERFECSSFLSRIIHECPLIRPDAYLQALEIV